MRIKTFWVACSNRGYNFGDWAGETIVKLVSGQSTEHVDVDRVNEADLTSAGSILHLLPSSFSGYVWGSGCIQDDHQFYFPSAKIQAVRGKLTAKRLGVDVPLGDPLLLWQGVKKPKYNLGIVPHYIDWSEPAVHAFERENESVLVVDICARDAADRIASCSHILSSCLHGLVLADAMGIPNQWMLLSDNKVVGHGFKFRDYYSAFDIDDPIPHRFKYESLNDVISRIEDNWQPRPLNKIQRGLLESFPKELLANETPLWEERSKVIASLIPQGSSVIDFGAGTQSLGKYVSEYQPCDVIKTSPETIVCDFNLNQYPEPKRYNFVVISGVMEYISTPMLFLQRALDYGDVILSYAPRVQDIEARRLSGWVNHLSREEFEGMFIEMGLNWELKATWHEQLVYVLSRSS